MDLITTCAKCSASYGWNDSYQEYPDCPRCGYNAMKELTALLERFRKAVEAGDMDAVRQQFTERVRDNLNAGPWTALHHAAFGDKPEAAEYLLDNGADPNRAYRGAGEQTPLHSAVEKQSYRIVRLFLVYGANVHAKNAQGSTPLDLAVGLKDQKMIALLNEAPALVERYRDVKKRLEAQAVIVRELKTEKDLLRKPLLFGKSKYLETLAPIIQKIQAAEQILTDLEASANQIKSGVAEPQARGDGMISFKCSSCGVALRVPASNVGKKGKCPKCGGRVEVPAPGAAKPPGGVRQPTEREAASLSTGLLARSYRSDRFHFTVSLPANWQTVRENDRVTDWEIPIAVASPMEGELRGACLINVREADILNRNERVRIFHTGKDGTVERDPGTPEEYIAWMMKRVPFEQTVHIMQDVITVSGLPAARMVYSYVSDGVCVRELSVTVFGLGISYQFVCEMPDSQAFKYMPIMEAIVASFKAGDRAAAGQAEPKEQPQTPVLASDGPIAKYNQGVSLFGQGQLRQAEAAFLSAFKHGDAPVEIKMAAAYARGITQMRMGVSPEMPAELGDRTEEAGCAYIAYTLAGTLAGDGHEATVSDQNGTWRVDAVINDRTYRFSVNSILGRFMNNGWRIEGGKEIGLGEATSKPSPIKDDLYALAALKRVSSGSAPPTPMPASGFPKRLQKEIT